MRLQVQLDAAYSDISYGRFWCGIPLQAYKQQAAFLTVSLSPGTNYSQGVVCITNFAAVVNMEHTFTCSHVSAPSTRYVTFWRRTIDVTTTLVISELLIYREGECTAARACGRERCSSAIMPGVCHVPLHATWPGIAVPS